MLNLLKSIAKLKENWPKNTTRKYFIQYDGQVQSKKTEESKFVKSLGINGKRQGHPEYITYVNLDNENYICIGNITHKNIINNNTKFYSGVKVGKDLEGNDMFFVIEDIKFKKVGVDNIKYLCEDLVNNICKSDVKVSKDVKKVSENVAILMESFLRRKGFKDIFVHNEILNQNDFIKQTEIILSEMKKGTTYIKKDD